jgi:polar amino acid transport system permease protein
MPNILDVGLIFTQIPTLLAYLPVTLFITFFSMLLGIILGLMIAIAKMNKIPILSPIATVFVSFIRGTPLLVQLYLSFYGIPILLRYINYFYGSDYNINGIPPMLFVLIAFSFNEAAYNSETIRAALQSVNKGQIEAAQSLGMTYSQLLRRIVIPEAFIVALPNLGNAMIGLLKGTSLAFVCSVTEMTGRGKTLAGHSYRYFEVYISLALIYWVLTIIIELIVKYLEKRLTISDCANTPSYRRGKLL